MKMNTKIAKTPQNLKSLAFTQMKAFVKTDLKRLEKNTNPEKPTSIIVITDHDYKDKKAMPLVLFGAWKGEFKTYAKKTVGGGAVEGAIGQVYFNGQSADGQKVIQIDLAKGKAKNKTDKIEKQLKKLIPQATYNVAFGEISEEAMEQLDARFDQMPEVEDEVIEESNMEDGQVQANSPEEAEKLLLSNFAEIQPIFTNIKNNVLPFLQAQIARQKENPASVGNIEMLWDCEADTANLLDLCQEWLELYNEADETVRQKFAKQSDDVTAALQKAAPIANSLAKLSEYAKKKVNKVIPNLDGLKGTVGPKMQNHPADVLAVQYYLNMHGFANNLKVELFNARQVKSFATMVGLKTSFIPAGNDSEIWLYLSGQKEITHNNAQLSEDYYNADKREQVIDKVATILADTDTDLEYTYNAKALKRKANPQVLLAQKMLNAWGNYGLITDGLMVRSRPETGKADETFAFALQDFRCQMGLPLPSPKQDKYDLTDVWPYLKGEQEPKKSIRNTAQPQYGKKPKWLTIAEGEIGVREMPDSPDGISDLKAGKAHNPRIVEYHSATQGFGHDEAMWCASFVSWCLSKAGVSNPRDAGVPNWKGWGTAHNKPFYGAIAIVKNWGHIGFVVGIKKGSVQVLGGNQGQKVGINNYPIAGSVFLAPPGYEPPTGADDLLEIVGAEGDNGTT